MLRQNLPEDVLRTDIALTVADGNVLGDRTSVVVDRIGRDHSAFPCDRSVHFADNLASVITDYHSGAPSIWIHALRSRSLTVPYPIPSFSAISRRLAPAAFNRRSSSWL